ncbi:MAG: hypothetical protein CL677_06350 [Bdellovibrionaceae bacterium]|nr:hypothetical protein [Pseudobdellovibrionaceae bacterium]|tara:strand:- start:62658 stop:63836 length:1179 start_codon:yes stop_codon:yes gene_type:complete
MKNGLPYKPYEVEVKPGVFKTYYRVQVEGINKFTGKRVQKKQSGITSKPKAESIAAELRYLCKNEKPTRQGLDTWGELKDYYLDDLSGDIRSSSNPIGISPALFATKRSRLKHLDLWQDLHLDLVNQRDLKKYLDNLEVLKGVSRALTIDIQKEAKAMMSYAYESGIMESNPLSGMKHRKAVKKRKLALNPQEVEVFLGEARLRKHPYFLPWLLAISLGMRRSELAGLRWTDLDLEKGLVDLQRQHIPGEGVVERLKSGQSRMVGIPKQIVPELKATKLKSKSDYVIDPKTPYWADGKQAKVTKDFCREIGIKEVTFHNLRATHITLAVQCDIPVGVIKENVGHSSLHITDGYVRASGMHIKGKMDKLGISVPQADEGQVITLKSANGGGDE